MQLDTIIKVLKHTADFQNLDVLALQEASIHDQEDAQVIADQMGSTYDYFQVTADQVGGQTQANALVWNTARLHVESKDSVKLPRQHEVHLPRYERALLRALPTQQRISLVVNTRLEKRHIRIYVAHLDVLGFEHKREQLKSILVDTAKRSPADLTLIAGDLNTFKIRRRPTWRNLIETAGQVGFYDLTTQINWTHSVSRFNFRQKLDAVFIKCGTDYTYRSWALNARGSDHIPVFVDIVSE